MYKLKLKRQELGNFRQLSIKKRGVDFASNDYLGLAHSYKLKRAIFSEWKNFDQMGSKGSRLLCGNNSYVEALEAKIAAFHGYEMGLIFNCGFMANLGLLSSIAEEYDTLLFDSGVHASTREGLRLAKARSFAFRHNDLNHLEKKLQSKSNKGRTYICIESIYSIDGSKAPLRAIFELSKKYCAHFIIDDAHSVGVFGKQGKGCVHEAGLSGKVFAQIVTFGKALGVFGAIVLGQNSLKEMLVNFAKSFIYTTALPYYSLAAIHAAYQLFPHLDAQRAYLQSLIKELNLSETPIQPFPVADNHAAHQLVSAMEKEGVDVRAFLSPTVQRGQEHIRLIVHAFNTKQELDHLMQLLRCYG